MIWHPKEFSTKDPVFVLGITLSTAGFFFLISILSITILILMQAYIPIGNRVYTSIVLYYLEDLLASMFVFFIVLCLALHFAWMRKGTFYFYNAYLVWRIGSMRVKGNYENMKYTEFNAERSWVDTQRTLLYFKRRINKITFDYANLSHNFKLSKKNRILDFEEFLKQHLEL